MATEDRLPGQDRGKGNAGSEETTEPHILSPLEKFRHIRRCTSTRTEEPICRTMAAAIRARNGFCTTNFKKKSNGTRQCFYQGCGRQYPHDTGSSGEKVTGPLFDVPPADAFHGKGMAKPMRPGSNRRCSLHHHVQSAVNDCIERVTATRGDESNFCIIPGIPYP